MADEGKLNGLTRRRVLGSLGTVGIAAGAGGATWAQMHDTETKEFTVTAGTLDLTVDGENGETIEVPIGPLSNGECEAHVEELENVGDVTGTHMCFEVTNVRDKENGLEEPEEDAGDETADEGELSDHLTLQTSLWYPYEEDEEGRGPEQVVYDDTPLTELEDDSRCCELREHLGEGDTVDLQNIICVEDEDVSDAMTDQVVFDFEITLYDEEPPE